MSEQKNYFYLLNEMKHISKNFELDIVGEGLSSEAKELF